MKTKIYLITILLLLAVLFASCATTPDSPPTTNVSTSDSIPQTTTDLPQNTEPTTQDNLTEAPTEKPEDPFESLRSSGEEWISYGLAAYENEKQVENLKEFFSDAANMTYLTLYDHFFTYDKAKSVPVAEAVFAFIYNEYGVEALLDLDKRCEYKTAYLKSLGLEVEYTNPPEVEAFLSSMNFSSNATYKYIISFGNVTYYFKDFSASIPAGYHQLLYYNTTGLFEMIDYLKENKLDEGLDTNREFHYYMLFDGSGYSQTRYPSGNMYINDFSTALHESMHALGIRSSRDSDNLWLSEGLCNYFGKTLGFNEQIAVSYIQIMNVAKQGYFDEYAATGDKSAIICKNVYEDYIALGGKFDLLSTFDLPLYTNLYAKAELDVDFYNTIAYTYKRVNGIDYTGVGAELSYNQATSLVLYLVDTYGVKKVLDAYHSQNIESALGKGYEELKADWLAYLYK